MKRNREKERLQEQNRTQKKMKLIEKFWAKLEWLRNNESVEWGGEKRKTPDEPAAYTQVLYCNELLDVARMFAINRSNATELAKNLGRLSHEMVVNGGLFFEHIVTGEQWIGLLTYDPLAAKRLLAWIPTVADLKLLREENSLRQNITNIRLALVDGRPSVKSNAVISLKDAKGSAWELMRYLGLVWSKVTGEDRMQALLRFRAGERSKAMRIFFESWLREAEKADRLKVPENNADISYAGMAASTGENDGIQKNYHTGRT